MNRVLLLGGTAEARSLADRLVGVPGLELVSSLAGRLRSPVLPPGESRIGGFGGVDGLADWLVEHRVSALVDATHPFAVTISDHAATAAARSGVPLLVLRRPGWTPRPGDRWTRVASMAAAARALTGLGERVLLTTGRLGVAEFAGCDRHWFAVRSIEPPEPPVPTRMLALLDRGPFTVHGELELLRRHRIDVLVSKDSGGAATAAKLVAARRLGLPVVLIDRPPTPSGALVVADVPAALDGLDRLLASGHP